MSKDDMWPVDPKAIVKEWTPALKKLKDAQHPTPSNNIDTELQQLLYECMYTEKERKHIKNDGSVFLSDVEAAMKLHHDILKAERDKLIKHLAFYYGLPVAEVRKVAEDVK